MAAKRSKIFWLGEIRPETQEFIELLQFSVDNTSSTARLKDDGFLEGLAAVVFAQDAKKPMSILPDINSYAPRLLDFDCLVFALASNAGLESVVNVLTAARIPSIWATSGPEQFAAFDGQAVRDLTVDGEPPLPHMRLYRASGPSEQHIAKLVHQYASSVIPASGNPKEFQIVISGSGSISTEERLLLRRSFHDCSRVDLTKIEGGRSGARVFMAQALVRGAPVGRRTLPFFVKLAERTKIITEWFNYELYVEQYIPFHLAPRLIPDRCGLGAYRGILVGDFVDESESLRLCSRGGRAVGPLGGLFERTLRGWHLHAVRRRESLYSAMKGIVAGSIPAARLTAAKALGARGSFEDLKEELRKRGKEWVIWGPRHADLHADNICVRGNDAILIDFYCTRLGPILDDPAALEVSLTVGVPLADDFDKVAWTDIMESLYSQAALEVPPSGSVSAHRYEWLAKSIRQIRLHALPLQQENGQYARLLALRFLQAATKDPKALPPEDFRRTSAFCFAGKLLDIKWSP